MNIDQKRTRCLIIIPCYNEGKNISSVVKKITEQILSINTNNYGAISADYLVINDCSTDNSLAVLKQNDYNYLSLPMNLGIGGCVQTGYRYALSNSYDIAIQHDGDGQHDPNYLIDVIEPIITGQADIVIGSRFLDKQGFQSTGLRRFGIVFLSKIILLCTGVVINDVTSGYRAVNRKFIELFAEQYAQDYPEPESIVDAARNKAVIKEVPVIMHERKDGKSSIGSLKSIYYMIKVSLSIILHRVIQPRKGAEING